MPRGRRSRSFSGRGRTVGRRASVQHGTRPEGRRFGTLGTAPHGLPRADLHYANGGPCALRSGHEENGSYRETVLAAGRESHEAGGRLEGENHGAYGPPGPRQDSRAPVTTRIRNRLASFYELVGLFGSKRAKRFRVLTLGAFAGRPPQEDRTQERGKSRDSGQGASATVAGHEPSSGKGIDAQNPWSRMSISRSPSQFTNWN